jgi:5'-3' exonuclease
MIVLFDADSLVYSSCCGVDDILDEAIGKFDQVFMSIINRLEEIYEIEKVITFNNSRGNFRKLLDPNYKANRKKQEHPKLLNKMHEEIAAIYSSKSCYGMETDDLVATYWKKLTDELGQNNVIIVSLDKDYKQLPCILYNYHYQHQTISNISYKESLYNFYSQMIIGDSADNVNYCKGYGKAYVKRLFQDCETNYQFTKKTYELYKEIYKSKGKQKYIQCYNLLRLRIGWKD